VEKEAHEKTETQEKEDETEGSLNIDPIDIVFYNDSELSPELSFF
jgi:hypothetical protein